MTWVEKKLPWVSGTFELLLASLSEEDAILFNRTKNPNFFRMSDFWSLRSSVLSGTIETTIMRITWLSYFPESLCILTHAIRARKQISIKFSLMEKSVSGFIWAADKRYSDINNFWTSFRSRFALDPLLTILITIYRQSLSVHQHCISSFVFIKDLLLFISSVMQSAQYWLGYTKVT